ncbi:HNH endonuclease signature motif containing protein [Rhodovulum euryhalinum]|uniref:HNH endonuclease n=1 Tax=Rhodovulum euryhalinum TaxID=35805 RepID=A0A4R2KJQ1_9RHOB|nr:HNH endonuclease signature motif containing protein [Rhodovulum euryhalinum]TCO70238.1 HNH endonuclease [Rhodovulum euryhalinum]
MYIDKHGYPRVSYRGKPEKIHRLIWRMHHGAIPPGYEIHHKNEDKLDWRIENLELVSKIEHRKRHAGVMLNDAGQLVKRCARCGKIKPVDGGYYRHPKAAEGYVRPYCKECHVRSVVESEQRVRAGSRKPRIKAWRDWLNDLTPEHFDGSVGDDLARAIAAQPARTRRILRTMFVEQKTMQAAADDVGISVGQASRIVNRAVSEIDEALT